VPAPETAAAPAGNSAAPAAAQGTNETPASATPDPDELKPNVGEASAPTTPPPPQVNELAPGADGQAAKAPAAQDGNAGAGASSSSADKDDDDAAISSSKHKKKKGLRKVVPF
jgi:outer membrane protein assembly factor BamD